MKWTEVGGSTTLESLRLLGWAPMPPRPSLAHRHLSPCFLFASLSLSLLLAITDPLPPFFMESPRQRSVHEMLGGGLLADVILWRRRHLTVGIVIGMFAAWVIFELSRYTLLSLVSRVLLLLMAILFAWAKAAGVLNRPPPPIPELYITEEATKEAANFLRAKINIILSSSRDIALGGDSDLFYKVSACLWIISVVSSWSDFLTLACTGLAVILTIPVSFEKYEGIISKYLLVANRKLRYIYERFDEVCLSKARKWILEENKAC